MADLTEAQEYLDQRFGKRAFIAHPTVTHCAQCIAFKQRWRAISSPHDEDALCKEWLHHLGEIEHG